MPDISQIIDEIIGEKDLLKKARLIKDLNRGKGVRIKEISSRIGLKPSYTCHLIRLTKLPILIVDGYYSKLVSISHLFIISRLRTEEEMAKAYEKVLSEDLSVFQTERTIREILYGIKDAGDFLNSNEIEDSKKILNDQNIDLKVNQSRSRSKITIELKGNLEETSERTRRILSKISSSS